MVNFFDLREQEIKSKLQKIKDQIPDGYMIVPITPTSQMLKASSLSIGQAQPEYYRMIGVYPPYVKDSL